jgi:hypothetical protein
MYYDFGIFLDRLFREGTIAFVRAQETAVEPSRSVDEILGSAFETHRLSIAGPQIAFDRDSARRAADFLRHACLGFVLQEEIPTEAFARLGTDNPSGRPEAHLSVDLTYRYLPIVYRRSAAIGRYDVLRRQIELELRKWPFSGVLANLLEPPLGSLEFSGHQGLAIAYAERFIEHQNEAWRPPESSCTANALELVSSLR